MPLINNKFVNVLLASLSVALGSNVVAQQTTNSTAQNPVILAMSSLSAPPTPDNIVTAATPASADAKTSTDSFEDWVASFEKQFQKVGISSEGKIFFSGQAATLTGPKDPSIGKQLAVAYEKAMFDMRADFVMQSYGRIKTKTIRDVLDDQSTNKDEFDPVQLQKASAMGGGRLDELLDKALTVIDKKLDNELVAQGVPADQIQRMSVEQKKITFKNNLTKEITKTAFKSMQGLVPVQTKIFTKKTANGVVVIVGVIAVQSEKTRQFALDISKKTPTLVRGDPRKLVDILPKDKAGFLDEIGLRYTYDESGRPMLISYGRSSITVPPDMQPSRVFQSTQNAQSIARDLAEASIAEFISTNININSTTITGSIEQELVTQITNFENGSKANVQKNQEIVAETISKTLKSGTATAQADLKGTAAVDRWEFKDEYGVLQVGTVVSWSYGQLESVNAIDAQTNRNAAQSNQSPITEGTRSSKPINKANDF